VKTINPERLFMRRSLPVLRRLSTFASWFSTAGTTSGDADECAVVGHKSGAPAIGVVVNLGPFQPTIAETQHGGRFAAVVKCLEFAVERRIGADLVVLAVVMLETVIVAVVPSFRVICNSSPGASRSLTCGAVGSVRQ
jgi:hypothetical protein